MLRNKWDKRILIATCIVICISLAAISYAWNSFAIQYKKERLTNLELRKQTLEKCFNSISVPDDFKLIDSTFYEGNLDAANSITRRYQVASTRGKVRSELKPLLEKQGFIFDDYGRPGSGYYSLQKKDKSIYTCDSMQVFLYPTLPDRGSDVDADVQEVSIQLD